jgi:hypothetical protein
MVDMHFAIDKTDWLNKQRWLLPVVPGRYNPFSQLA